MNYFTVEEVRSYIAIKVLCVVWSMMAPFWCKRKKTNRFVLIVIREACPEIFAAWPKLGPLSLLWLCPILSLTPFEWVKRGESVKENLFPVYEECIWNGLTVSPCSWTELLAFHILLGANRSMSRLPHRVKISFITDVFKRPCVQRFCWSGWLLCLPTGRRYILCSIHQSQKAIASLHRWVEWTFTRLFR